MPTYTLNNVNYTYTVGTVSASVGTSASASGSITLLSSFVVDGATYNVTSIAASAFLNKTGLTSVVIPDSVTSIGASAFSGCTNLLPIIFPNTLTTIGTYAFAGCSKFSTVTIPTSMTTISTFAFDSCSGLTTVNIPNTVTIIGSYAFATCIALQNLTIPNSVTTINQHAFLNCSGLTTLTIPNSVTTINQNAFYGCTGLTEITLSNALTTIGANAFQNCSGFTSLTLPATLTSVGGNAFTGCSKVANVLIKSNTLNTTLGSILPNNPIGISITFDYVGTITTTNLSSLTHFKNLIIGNNITSIGTGVFANCANLLTVTIPNTVTSIGIQAFQRCSNLTTVTIPNTLTTINNGVFQDCYKLSTFTIPNTVTTIGEYAFTGCAITSINIPNVTFIGLSAFEGSSLTSVDLPSAITISEKAFYGCSRLTSVTLSTAFTTWNGPAAFQQCEKLVNVVIKSLAGCGILQQMNYSDNLSVTFDYTGAIPESITANVRNMTNVTFGPNITSIGLSSFENCAKLTTVTIPDKVISIGNTAFKNCSVLNTVTFNTTTAFRTIGSNAFNGCLMLVSINIPSSTTTINNAAFYQCTKLSTCSISQNMNISSIGDDVFYNCSSLSSIVIPSSVRSIGNYSFYNCKSLTTVNIPTLATSIGNGAFFGSGLTSIVIPNVSAISSYAFYSCTNLTSITIPNTVWLIDTSAFANCSSLTSITIPASVTTIRNDSFNETGASLTSITVAATNPNFSSENGVFFNKNKTTLILYPSASPNNSYVIPSTVTSISAYAFVGCSNLTSITIPNSVTNIPDLTFYRLTNSLSTIVINANNTRFLTENGVLFNAAKTTLMLYPPGLLNNSYVIPSTVTSINSSAFSGCTNLTSVTIPSSVTTIKDSTFFGCTNLTTISIPSTITSIAANAFFGCSGLTSVTIPASLTSIGYNAFFGCSGLTSVTIPASVTSIGADAFRNCTSLSSITVAGTNVNYLSENGILFNKAKTTLILYPPASLNISYVIPSTVYAINAYAFNQCANLTTVTIPSGMGTINDFTFTLCNLLSTVIILGNVPVIYSNNFSATGDTAVYINSTANINSSFKLSMFTNVISQNIPTLTNFPRIDIPFSNVPYKIPPPTSDMSGVFTYESTDLSISTVSGDMLTTVRAAVGNSYIYATQTVTYTYGAGTLTTSALIATGSYLTKGSPIMSFSIPAKKVGDAAFTLVPPTSDSSGTFTYTSSNTAVATVTNAGLITVKVAGVTNITANQAATTNWLAKSIVATFAVDASTSTITPTITNFSIPPKALGSAAFSLVPPTSDSSGAFTYTSSNTAVATVSGTTVTVVAVGRSTITAVQAGNATYKSGSIASEFVVSLTQPTILSSFSVPAKTFGDASFSIVPPTTNGNGTFTYTSSDISVATIVGNTVTIVGAGSSTITATQSATAAFTSATITAPLTVGKATPTITDFSVVSKAVGDASFSLVNPTSNSVGAFTYTSSDTSVATIAGNVVTIVGVGSSTITAVQASSTNYLSGSTTAVFQVTQGVLTLTNFSVPAKSVGNADFVLVPPTTGSTGLITYTSSDTSVATISGNVVTIVGVGSSTITASQESTANYTSATITASFTVGLAATITDFSVSAKTFGDVSFSLVNPTSDSDGLFTYISSDISVATIDGSIVTIVGGGTTTITAVQALTSTYGPGSITASFVVNQATTILTDFSVATKTFGDASFNIIAPTTNGNGAFTYTSSDTSVATVSGSVITIVGAGTSTITAVQAATTNYLSETITSPFTVNQLAPTITNFVVPAKITADASFSLIAPTSNSSGAFTYTSSDTSVATIDGSMVTILGNGSSIITATQESTANYLSGSITSTLIVRLTPILTDFSVPAKIIGDVSFSLVPPTTNSDGVFTYISSDISIATIVGNRVNIVRAGTVTITANQSLTDSYGAGTITASFVVNKQITTISAFTIAPKPFGSGRFSIGFGPSSNRAGSIVLTSSNPSIAIVEHQVNQGVWLITPVAIGNATIIATQASTDIFESGTSSTNFNVYETIPYTYENVNYVYNIGLGTADVTGGITTTPTSLTVLESFVVNGITYTVTHIRDGAFNGYTNLTGISLPPSILTIGYNCFGGSGLTTFTFPPLVTTIEQSTFGGSALTSITIPPTITTIKYIFDGKHGGSSTGPFGGCSKLENLVVNTYISGFQYIFWRLNNVNMTVTFDYAGSVPPNCLQNSTSLNTLIIGNQITSIDSAAFDGCTSLMNVTLGSSLTTIGGGAFGSCRSLQNITIPSSVTTIGGGAFTSCSSLNNVTIPSSVTTLGFNVFDSCTSFTTMTIPSTLTSIGWYIFNNCTNLTNIIVKGRFDVLIRTFNTVNSLNMSITFDYSGFVPGSICTDVTNLKTVKFSNLITGIEGYAFSGCTGLNEIIFPSSITTIQNYAFFNCPNLNSVSFLGEIATIGTNNFTSTTDTCYYNVDEVINADPVAVDNKLTMFTNKSIILTNVAPTITNFVTPMKKYNDISFSIVDPSSNSSGSFSYTSSNTSVATVSGNTVTVGTSGSTTMTATQAAHYRNGVSYTSGTITSTFVVDNPPPQLGPLVIPNLSLSDVSFYITPPTKPENSSGTWSYASSDLTKATVSGNIITLISVGIVKISATITSDSNYCETTVVALFSISAPNVVPSSFEFVSATDVSNAIPPTVKTDTTFIVLSPTIFTPETLEIMNPSVGIPEEKIQNRNVLVDTLFERFSTVNTITIPPTAFYMPSAIDLSNITAVKVIKTNGTTLQSPRVIDASTNNISTAFFCEIDEIGNSVLFNGTSSFVGYNVKITKVAYNNYTVVQTKPASSTIVTKTFNIVDGSGVYTINGVNNNDISLIRGNKYNLVVNATGHPFWIQSVSGQYSSTNVYSSGITNNGTQTSTITFTVPTNAPNTLYYASQNNSSMQGRILITDITPTTYSAVNDDVIYYAGFKLVLGSITGQLSSLILVTLSNFSLPVKTLDAAPFTITPPTTISSGAFTYTSSDASVATIVGNVVTVVGLGTATITAVQARTTTHLSDTITTEFTVNKIPTVLSNFVVPTKIYGNAAFTITPPTTNSDGEFTYSSSNTAVATIDGSSITIVGVGTATITAVQATSARFITASITGNFVVNKITPTITNFSVPVKTFGDASFSIIAPTTDSDGVFTYTSSNTAVATVSGTTITIVGGGSATITANQSTTTNYLAATTTASLVVNKATTVLSNFSDVSKTFGNAAFAIVPPTTNGTGAFTYTSSNTAVATIAGSTITIVGGGTATITANQATNANYLAATITATLTVSQATPIITNFSVPTKIVGNAAFTITAPTTNSTGAFTYTSSNTAVATIVGNTVTIVGVGSSTITADQASTTNYISGTITANFQVNQITTVLSNFSIPAKQFANADFSLVTPTTNSIGAFTYTSSNPAVATIVGNTVTIVGVGTSTITASQASTTNYTAGTITTSLTVSKATTVLTNFVFPTKTFGDASFNIVPPTTNGDGGFTYTSSNTAVATIAGNMITIIGAGTSTITVSQATTINYLAATTTATLTVNKATTVLTNFIVPVKVIRNAPFSIIPPTTNSIGAFTYTSSNAAVATIVGSTITINGIGTSTITASQATTSNYTAATVTAVFQVNNVTPTLSFSIPTKTIIDASYTIAPPTSNSSGAFTYTSSNPLVATIVNGLVTILALGSTTITAVQAETSDYVSGTITATLTITKATPALVFSIPVKTIGNPTFLITPTTDSDGLMTYVSANLEVATIVGNRVTLRGVGTSIISVSQASTANYTSITVTNTLQVNLITTELTNFLLPAKTFGDIPYKIQASSNSSAGITYTSSDPEVATIVGDMVTIVGAGSSTITASQDSWFNFASATISETLQVNQLTTLLSRFSVPVKIFGNADFALIPPLSNRAGAFTYTSSNPEIATIDGNLVTILGTGTASITASQASTPNSTSESITATFQVNPAIPALTNFAVPTKTFGSAAFSLVPPSSTSDGAFTYTTSNPTVATVAGDVVTIVGAGNATITAVQASTANYISGIITAQFTVTKGSSTLTNFSVPEKSFGSADFVLVPPTSNTNAIFTYTSSNLSVATIARNVVTIVGIGSSTITATQASSANYTSGMISATFTVSKTTPLLTNFVVPSRAVGDASFSLVAPTSNSDGAFTYTSSDLSVATIEENVVTIVGSGTSTITATQVSTNNFLSGSTTALFEVNRIPTVLTSFTVPVKTFGDASFSLVAPTSNREGAFVYTSSDPTVATIDGDTVTIVGGGNATITAVQSSTASYRSGTISALLQVNRVKTELADFSVLVKIVGEDNFTLVPPVTNSDGAFTYTSSNPAVATIDGDVVTIVGLGVSSIVASQSITPNYTSASIATTFQVKRIRTVLSNFVIPSKTIGDTNFTLIPPTTNSDGSFSYVSSNRLMATVSGDVVTVVGTGNVTIIANQESTFNSTSGQITASLVVNKATDAISWFSVPEKTFGNAPFTITPPTTNSNGLITYTSSDTSVATIERNVVTIVGIGSATITAVQAATINYASGTISATFNVIEGSPSLANFSVPAKTVGDATFTIVPPTSKSNGAFTYSSSNTAVATVAGDVVTIVGVGSSTITANQASTEVFVSGLITSTLEVNPITTTLTGFSVPAKTFGDATFALVPPTTNSNGLITYTSSTPAVATVSGDIVTIVGGGNATITAVQASATNYLAATITALLQVNRATTVLSNFSVPAKIIGDAAFAVVPPTTNSDGVITYTSSNPEVATIEDGVVTIVGLGTSAITAVIASTSNYTSDSIRSLFQVNVITTVLTNFVVPSKKMGESAFTFTPPTSNTNGLITYSSSNLLVATVSGDVVTIVGVGTSTITALQSSTTNSTSAFIRAPLVVTKTVTAISDFSLPVRAIGNASFAITRPTTNSNGDFTYSSSNPEVATISKNIVTIVGVGTSTITASQVSTAIYTSGTITALLQVNLGTPVLTNFASLSRAFGSANFSLVPPTTTSDGEITYTSSNGAVATIAGSTVTIVGAGTTTITANQSSTSRYSSGTITTTLTVNSIASVLTNFSVASKLFGDASFALVPPSSTGNGDFTYTSSNAAVATITGNVVTIVGGGSSTITATQASTTNYTSASITALFQVTSSTTVLTNFSAVSKTFGNAPFALVPPTSNRDGAFTYTSSDIKVATIAENMVTIVGAGTSTITAVQTSNANYSAATTTATLTVNKGTPVITFTMPTKEMGKPNFTIADISSNSNGAFTYTSSNATIATIVKDVVTIKGIGTSTITATQAMTANFVAGTATASFVVSLVSPTIINFTIPATKTVGDATFKITAPKSNSTGAFTFTSSNTAVATILKGVVTIVGAGTTTISAAQPSTKSYGPGTVISTLTVNKRTAVLSRFSITKKILGTAPFAIAPPTTNSNGLFTYTSSNPSVATIDGNMVTIVGVGSSTITASQEATTNFTSGTISTTLIASLPIPQVGALEITNKSLTNPTFTIVDPTKPNNNTGTWTYTSSDTTKATINGNSVILFQTGIVTITASLSGDSTYSPRILMTQFSISEENVAPSSFVFIKSSEVEAVIPTTVLPGLSVVIPTTVSTNTNIGFFNPTAGTVAEKEANQSMIVNTLCNMFSIATTISIPTPLLYVPKAFNKTKLKTIKIVRPTGTTSENPLVINTVSSDSSVGFLCSFIDYGTSVRLNGVGSFAGAFMRITKGSDNKYAVVRTTKTNVTTTTIGSVGEVLAFVGMSALIGY